MRACGRARTASHDKERGLHPRRRYRCLVVAAGTIGFFTLGGACWLFIAVLVAPDLFLIGYVGGKRSGAMLYNAVHWYALPLALIVWGFLNAEPTATSVGLAWATYIGFDRALCVGLKYVDGFGFTHLGQVGKKA